MPPQLIPNDTGRDGQGSIARLGAQLSGWLGLSPRAGAGGKPQDKPDGPSKRRRDSKASMEPVSQRRRMADRPPSFTDLLPWIAYRPEDDVFVLKDGATLGAMFELEALPTEARPMSYLMERAVRVQEVLQAIPEIDGSPWIIQFFLSDDRNIGSLNERLRQYIADVHKNEPERQKMVLESPLTQAFLEEMRKHLAQVSKPEGLFTDTLVTHQVWRGQMRRVRCCIYKRFDASDTAANPIPATAQVNALATTLIATLSEAGVKARRCNGKDFYEWLLPFFNRRVPWAKSDSELLNMLPYPGDHPSAGRPANGDDPGEAPLLGLDLSDLLLCAEPYSDLERGTFEFNGVPVRAMVLQNIRKPPQIGHFTAELHTGDESYARFDRLPPGSMLPLTVAVRPQYLVQQHIERIRDASRAKTATAQETHRECELVLERMLQGSDKLFPTQVTLYLTGSDYPALESAITETNALLVPSGLQFIDPKQDLAPIDAFMRGLPFNFDPAFDQRLLHRARLTFASQIAALAPVYGRSRGTPHPGFWFWNRGGEPIWFDPLNKRDRRKNAHMLLFGPTGAGKSASLNGVLWQTMAIHRPRLIIVDAGKSFRLLGQYFEQMGLSTLYVELNADAKVSLPPFVNACDLLDDPDVMEAFMAAEAMARGLPDEENMAKVLGKVEAEFGAGKSQSSQEEKDEDESGEEEQRDLLAEMVMAAILMITGGEKREVEKMERADHYLIMRAIVRAAMRARQEGKAHPLVHDVAIELMNMRRDEFLSQSRRDRVEVMGQAMMNFTMGLRGKLFNRPGQDWPDVDVTIVEMGTLAKTGNGDALAMAYISLMNAALARGEKAQYEDRPLVFVTDESHKITIHELLGDMVAVATKMWRKLSMWFWMATQNIGDFPGSMNRVLSMCEYWMLLTMDKSEIEEVSNFRTLTDEQRHMIESARKEPPKYTEGVLINADGQILFRNVPPALPIAMAMTEGHEKAQRRRLMEQHGCTELQAAMMIAEQIASARG
jgi:conjugative transfer ATPase